MKETGIIRRIDELGRIVIPKEIRKTFRIKEGDSIEIFIDEERIVLQKYSLAGNMNKTIENYCDALNKLTENDVYFVENDFIVAASNQSLLNHPVSKIISQAIDNRKISRFSNAMISIRSLISYDGIIYPLIIHSDIIGGFIIIEKNNRITDEMSKQVEIILSLLNKEEENS